ncbi:MAG: hypothetical protein FI707_00980 [SAR202 cluster bacterium]|jgi:hypothetical protein|nr:hypothetical protein [SAR202 cluster bacterium]|tara:strand:+ start:1187 stop:1834 length:648 start_codon:yes stop_codon:yes gene_type:complete
MEAAETLRAESHWRRIRRTRLIGSVAFCGGGIGIAAIFITLMAAVEYPKTPVHLSFTHSLIMGAGAFVPSGFVAGLVTWVISERIETARGILVWVALGFAFGVSFPFVTGFFIPMSTVFVEFADGSVAAGDLFVEVVDSLFRGISVAFSHGAFGVFTGMLGGVFLTLGGWAIDRINSGQSSQFQRYGPPAIAVVLAVVVVTIASFGSAEFLAKLG